LKKFDIAILGGGILGTTISYWISNLYDSSVCVIEKESNVAQHTSGRNTGVVHTPFYLNPEKKKIFAKSAQSSHELWKTLAENTMSPWNEIGTIEVALNETQHKTLEKYQKWGIENGVSEENLVLLDSNEIKQKEKNVECFSGLLCKSDVSTDYSKLTQEIKKISAQNSTEFLFQKSVKSFIKNDDTIQVNFTDNFFN